MGIKSKNVCCFSDVFHFAENFYEVGWNACCDLFHRSEILSYQGTTDVCFDRIVEMTGLGWNEEAQKYDGESKELVKELDDNLVKNEEDDSKKAYYILGKFLIHNGVDEVMVTGD